MELWNQKKKILSAFGIFMGVMVLCTLISRAVYAAGLAQVETVRSEKKTISHKVVAEGIIKPEREYAVNILDGLKCRTVYVHEGDHVMPETLLFEAELEDLQEQIRQQELEIKKLSDTIEGQKYQEKLAREKQETQKHRAEDDYQRIDGQTKEAVVDAEEALRLAEERLEKAKADYEKHLENQPVKLPEGQENENGDEAQKLWTEQKEMLESRLAEEEKSRDSAEAVLKEAEDHRQEALVDAERRVEDADVPAENASESGAAQLELSALRERLEKYRKLLKADGKVYAQEEGIITGIRISPGASTGDGAEILYAGLDSPLKFCFSITKEQKKYVNEQEQARITLEKRETDVTIDYIRQNEINPELYDVTVLLPADTGKVGQSGIFEAECQSESYSCVIPLEALKEDENKRKYVYVLGEQSGILGKELVAERVYVRVLEQNDKEAAIEEGSIGKDTKLISDSTKELKDRMAVRYRE